MRFLFRNSTGHSRNFRSWLRTTVRAGAVAGAVLALFVMQAGCANSPETPRPDNWAQPVATADVENFHQVSDELFRSANPPPTPEAAAVLRKAGIKTIISLRGSHTPAPLFAASGFVVHHHPMEAGSVSTDDLEAVLRLFRDSPKPILVHCWHGADRTGFIVAGYRMVIQGWAVADAIRELRGGGHGFHEFWYGNIPKTLEALPVAELRAKFNSQPTP